MKKSFITTVICITCIMAACGNNTKSGNGTDSVAHPSKDTTFLNDTNRTLDTGNRKMDSLKAKAVDSAKRNPI